MLKVLEKIFFVIATFAVCQSTDLSICSELISCDYIHNSVEGEQKDVCFNHHLDNYSEKSNQNYGSQLHLSWNPSKIAYKYVDVYFYSISQTSNGTFIVRADKLMSRILNTGNVQLMRWMTSLLDDTQCIEGLIQIIPNKKKIFLGPMILKTFVLILDSCEQAIAIKRTIPPDKNINTDSQVAIFNMNLKLGHTQSRSQSKDFNFQLDNKGKMRMEIKTEGETFEIRVKAEEDGINFNIGTKKVTREDKQFIRMKREAEMKEQETDKLKKNYWLYQTFQVIHLFYKQLLQVILETYEKVVQLWRDWTYKKCTDWYLQEKGNPPNFSEVEIPPCSLEAALEDVRFKADTICHSGRGYCHYFHRGAFHCVMSRQPSTNGHAQQACYSKSGTLLNFRRGGGNFYKVHPDGAFSFIRSLKYFQEDLWPFLTCCKFSHQCGLFAEMRPTTETCEEKSIEKYQSIWWLYQ